MRITLSQIYTLLQETSAQVNELVSADGKTSAALVDHETRLKAHSDSIHSHGERIGKAEAAIDSMRADKAPKANGVTIASAIIAGLSVAVAVIAIIVAASLQP